MLVKKIKLNNRDQNKAPHITTIFTRVDCTIFVPWKSRLSKTTLAYKNAVATVPIE